MGKKRKDAPLVPPPIASRRVARRVTSEFHRLAQDAARAPTAAARAAAERVLEARRGRYQEASALSTALHSTSRWVLRVLRRRGVLGAAANARPPDAAANARPPDAAANARPPDAAANARPPALLEVGAVNTQLLEARGLAVRAIDVRSSMQRIERVDFFDLRPQGSYLRGNQPVSYVTTRPRGQRRVDGVESPHHRTGAATEARRVDGVGRLNSDFHTGSYDVVVCALVLNCLPDAAARGRMVAGLVAHLRPGGLCFLVVPRSCLERSAATTPARRRTASKRAGVVELERRATPRLLHLCLAAGGADAAPAPAPEHRLRPRRKKANEFDVVLPASSA